MIQKTMRRTFIKIGAVACAVAVTITLCAIFLLPKGISLFYYDPTEPAVNEKYSGLQTTRMDLDLAVYTELFLPGCYRGAVNAQPLGYGKYTISIPQVVSWNGKHESINGMLTRNKLTLYNPDLFQLPVMNTFVLPETVKGDFQFRDHDTGKKVGVAGLPESAYEQLEGLNDDEWYQAYISFAEITDYADFYQWLQTYLQDGTYDFSEIWCAVYTEGEDGQILGQNIGFNIYPGGNTLHWNQEKYPELSLLPDTDALESWPEMSDTARIQTHFVSLLQYMQDNWKFAKIMNPSLREPANFDEMMESVERDGLRLYGFSIRTRKDTLLKLRDDATISYIYAHPVKW